MSKFTNKIGFLVKAAVHEALAKTYGKKIMERASKDSTLPMMKAEINEAPGADMVEKLTHHIISHAPHDKYKRWMAKSYSEGGIPQLTDLSKTGHALELFHKHSAKLPQKDIMSYKGFHDLSKAVEPHAGTSKSAEKKGASQGFIDKKEATLVHESPEFRVVIPHTEEASKHFGKNTKWCTAAEHSRNYFNDYAPKGNLMYFLNKKENKRHAIFVPKKSFENNEYLRPEAFDEEDKSMSPKTVMDLHESAKKDIEKHVPSVAHRTTLGYETDPDEIETLVRKHIK
ncbi:MAG: hypothetical protein KGH75_01525 [Rhodospirillales bacterium]|nr:hypothetical protein [Rhodospirillales bacterium]